MLQVIISAHRPGGHHFTLFHRRLTAVLDMNTKTMPARWQYLQFGDELEAMVGPDNFYIADGLPDTLGGHKIRLSIFIGGLYVSAKREG